MQYNSQVSRQLSFAYPVIWCRNLHRLCLSIDRIWIDLCDNDRFHSDCSPLSSQQSEVCDYSLCLPASVKWRSPLSVDLVRLCEGQIYKDPARLKCNNVKVWCETEAAIWGCLWTWSVKMKLEADYNGQCNVILFWRCFAYVIFSLLYRAKIIFPNKGELLMWFWIIVYVLHDDMLENLSVCIAVLPNDPLEVDIISEYCTVTSAIPFSSLYMKYNLENLPYLASQKDMFISLFALYS